MLSILFTIESMVPCFAAAKPISTTNSKKTMSRKSDHQTSKTNNKRQRLTEKNSNAGLVVAPRDELKQRVLVNGGQMAVESQPKQESRVRAGKGGRGVVQNPGSIRLLVMGRDLKTGSDSIMELWPSEEIRRGVFQSHRACFWGLQFPNQHDFRDGESLCGNGRGSPPGEHSSTDRQRKGPLG